MEKDCKFCQLPPQKQIFSNQLALAVFDKYPVNHGHMLIIPCRHFPTIFEATPEEVLALHDLTVKAKDFLLEEYKPDGFNIGMNLGSVAGQTIFHLHIHIIPRYLGDVKNPRGGVRNLKPSLITY